VRCMRMLGVDSPSPSRGIPCAVNTPKDKNIISYDFVDQKVREWSNECTSSCLVNRGIHLRMIRDCVGRRFERALKLVAESLSALVIPPSCADQLLCRGRREADVHRLSCILFFTSSYETAVDGSFKYSLRRRSISAFKSSESGINSRS